MDIYSCVQGAHNEQWTFQPLDDGYVLIRNVSSTKCLTVENNGTDNNIPVLQYQCLLNYNAEWLPEKTNPEQVDWYQLRNRHSGKCLTVKGASSANNAKLLQYTCDPEQGNNQWSWANPSSGNIPYV